jgi:type I restriction enzyme M protein
MSGNASAGLIWSIAELLRGDYKQSDYGKVILPFTLLRRLDCVLAPTKAAVLAEDAAQQARGFAPDYFLAQAAGYTFYNTSPLDFGRLLGDPNNLRANLSSYIAAFSENARDIFEKYEFDKQLDKLDGANLLFQVVQKFAGLDLSPERVSNADMGLLFEELIRRFAELSNETAGEHYTPREVIRLMVDLLFSGDSEALTRPGVVRSVYDPCAGTGGMLASAE